MTIKTKEVFITDDGQQHATMEMAEHWELLKHLTKEMEASSILGFGTDYEATPSDFINWIDDHRNSVKAYINATDAMQKASLA